MAAAKKEGVTDPGEWRNRLQKRDADRKAAATEVARLKAQMDIKPAAQMKVANYTWRKGGFDNVGIVTATIENNNEFPVKDILLKCSFSANSGTHLSDTTHVIYDTVNAKGKRTFKDVNIGLIHSQASKSSCWVETALRL